MEVIASRALFLVLDGIDDCGREDREGIMEFLEFLQKSPRVKFCISYRVSGDSSALPDSDRLGHHKTLVMTDENPDIDTYIQTELKLSIESGRMVVREPSIVLEIQEALKRGAQRM